MSIDMKKLNICVYNRILFIMQQIIEFNKSLILTSNGKYPIVNYIHDINNLLPNKIDIEFMNDLLELVYENKINIHQDYLVKYGVLTDVNLSSHIKQYIINKNDKYNFIENIDYIMETKQIGNVKYSNNFKFHPTAFKKILLKAYKTSKYVDYYLLLEIAISYYKDYQNMYNEFIISKKDDKIDELSKQLNELLLYAKKSDETLSNLNKMIMRIENKLVDSAANIPPSNKLYDRFIVMYNRDNNIYHVIRCQDRLKTTAVKTKEKEGYTLLNGIEYKNVPNSIHLWNTIKSELLQSNNIIISDRRRFNTFKLNLLSEDELIELINRVFIIDRIKYEQ